MNALGSLINLKHTFGKRVTTRVEVPQNVLVIRKQLKVIGEQQTTAVESYSKTNLDIWKPAMGVCQ